MIDHVGVDVPDYQATSAFYEALELARLPGP